MDAAEWERTELSDAALVVRGGECTGQSLMKAAIQSIDDGAPPSVSAGCLPDADLLGILAAYRIPNRKVRRSTVGRLREAGFDVTPSEYYAHVSILVPHPVNVDTANALETLFDPAETNPNPRKPGNVLP